MERNIVNVQYQDKKNPGAFSFRAYSYFTALDLAVGDMVLAPVGKSQNIAMVSEINVPESKVDERILPMLKTIERKYEPEEKKSPEIDDTEIPVISAAEL